MKRIVCVCVLCAPSLLILKASVWCKISTHSLEWSKQPNLSNPHFLDYSHHPLRLPSASENLNTHINVSLAFFCVCVCRWPPYNHMTSQYLWAGYELNYTICMELVSASPAILAPGISDGWGWAYHQIYVQEWTLLYLASVLLLWLSEEGTWWDLTCQLLPPVPLFSVENDGFCTASDSCRVSQLDLESISH